MIMIKTVKYGKYVVMYKYLEQGLALGGLDCEEGSEANHTRAAVEHLRVGAERAERWHLAASKEGRDQRGGD